jgi:imidazolonepropionase-like amidohydrolase
MKLILDGGTLFDGTGKDPVDNSITVFDDNLVEYAGPAINKELPANNVRRFDTRGMFVMPGLIDSHLHLRLEFTKDWKWAFPNDSEELLLLRMARRAGQNVRAGFTTIREVGAKTELIIALRQAINEGEILGPRLIVSGNYLSITGGPFYKKTGGSQVIIDGPLEARKMVRWLVSKGVDLIKIMGTCTGGGTKVNFPEGGTFTDEELEAIVSEAHRAKRIVASHAIFDTAGIKQLVKAGVDTIEHGAYADDETIGLMAEKGTILVPTFKPMYAFRSPDNEKDIAPTLQAMQSVVQKSLAAGVTIAMGSDECCMTHGLSSEEIEYLVEAGLTPKQALIASTKHGGMACGMADKIGTLEPGKFADAIVVDGNPLEDVKILQDKARIRLVVKDGQVVVNRNLEYADS